MNEKRTRRTGILDVAGKRKKGRRRVRRLRGLPTCTFSSVAEFKVGSGWDA